jgi:hypothetical protein
MSKPRCPWHSAGYQRRCVKDVGHTGRHIDDVNTQWHNGEDFAKCGVNEATLLIQHRPTMQEPLPEEVIGMRLLLDPEAFGQIPRNVRVAMQRLARDYITNQCSVAWNNCAPKPETKNDEAN